MAAPWVMWQTALRPPALVVSIGAKELRLPADVAERIQRYDSDYQMEPFEFELEGV